MRRAIAIDFDGTICTNAYPNIGEPKWALINEALKQQKAGAGLILWTCREGVYLSAAVAACESWGLHFDAVNQSLPDWIKAWGTNPRKVAASEYWDDRAISIIGDTVKWFYDAPIVTRCGQCKYSAEAFVRGIIRRGHEAVLEHCSFTVKFICDRGVSHEIVRHRMASFCQESTRYCNYSKDKFDGELTFIKPCFWDEGTQNYYDWYCACRCVEETYLRLLGRGVTPQEARAVLPNSLKTELVMTANIREWRHFLNLRCDPAAHPQMREVALLLLDKLHDAVPVCFDDIWEKWYQGGMSNGRYI